MYKFARKPWWIVSHVVVVAIAVVFINLGFWQLRRHDERAAQNAAVIARSEAAPEAVGRLVQDNANPAQLRYRRTTATGTYVAGADLLVDNRSYEGLPGAWVVTPLRLDDGRVVAVSRGFVSTSGGDAAVPTTPTGSVTVEGTAVEWDGTCGTRDDDTGTPVGAACLNRAAVEQLAGDDVLDVAIQQTAATPADDERLIPVPLPELDAGPHRSYAVQWFLFTAIGLITYPLILRRVARYRAAEARSEEARSAKAQSETAATPAPE